MRSHQAVLRKIAEQNLDPRVAYVSAGDGTLKPKTSEHEHKHVLTHDSTELTEEHKELLTEANIVVEDLNDTAGTSSVDETESDLPLVTQDEVHVEKPKKKFPAKKKSTEV